MFRIKDFALHRYVLKRCFPCRVLQIENKLSVVTIGELKELDKALLIFVIVGLLFFSKVTHQCI